MKYRNSILGALVSALLAGCSFAPESDAFAHLPCISDDECGGNQVCFPDGCGDPGSNIAVEVQPSAAAGQLAQDFEVFEVRPNLDFQALQPSVLVGEVSQVSTTGENVGFSGEVTISASGESLLIPGRLRSAQFTVALEQGVFSVPIPTGQFTVAVQSSEGLTVPLYESNVVVQPGAAASVHFNMPAVAQLQRMDQRLLQDAEQNLPIQTTVMDVQAFDLETGVPISQKAQVSSGQMGSTGDFSLYFKAPQGAHSIQVKASPRDPSAFVPTKTFVVSLTDKSPEPLELGDHGVPVTITGVVTGTDTLPLANARVYVEGKVGGGGTFKSATATSDASGAFTLRSLPSGRNGDLRLWIIPPANSASGLTAVPVHVSDQASQLGALMAPDKIPVTGVLLRPDSGPAVGVPVEARAVAKLDQFPLPDGVVRGFTDDAGVFTLRLDPGIYRFDFLPTDGYPRASRIVTLRPEVGSSGDSVMTQELPPFFLSRGRRITGKISSIPDRLGQSPASLAPYATVKFFRVGQVEGRPASFLLAEGVADATGTYSVLLPTKDAE
ncbi:MAG: carboxypeptidase-like regulatory domain-containing protein [Myxococcaceae bacterium]